MVKVLLSVVCIAIVFVSGCAPAQNSSSDKQAEQMLIDFYTQYITTFSTERDLRKMDEKLESLQRQHCTENFLRKIPEIIEQTDADPILKAQDSNLSDLETLTVTKDSQSKSEFIVSYSYDLLMAVNPDKTVKQTVVVHLTLVKEDGIYKIDSVR